ncbi:uncharacterized protein [Haliotis asinina]|uniref:uncharacterized protein n=1 Tax=Haliotis asinina TaxID=109174 RepID=UPI0035324010
MDMRELATNDFKKNLYKLISNSEFVNTMENLRKCVSMKLVRSNEEDKLRNASLAYIRSSIFDDDLAAIHMKKSHIKLNQPIYVSMSILDLFKHLMYDFYYIELKKQYGDRCGVLYTDTDSLLMEIQTEDVHEDMKSYIYMYDTSDYPRDHPMHSKVNKKVVGKMKDEGAGTPITEYVGSRPKIHFIKKADYADIRKSKGVKKNVVKRHIKHTLYKQAPFENKCSNTR